MEIHQLEYVLAVAKCNNFTSAAKEMNISQSSLSQQISKLENELGINLFIRTTRSVQLTPAGVEFVANAKRVMSALRDTYRCVNEYTTNEKGHLTLGILPIVGYYPIPAIIASFQKQYPGVTINLLESQCDELLQMLYLSKIDAAFVQQANQSPYFSFNPIIRDQMVVVTSENHPLASRKSLELKELVKENFIIPPPPSGHYQDFVKACHSEGFLPNIIVTCSHVRTILGLVRENLGITLLSSQIAALDVDPSLTIIPMTTKITRKIYLVTRANTDANRILEVFVRFVLQWIETRQHR